VNNDAISRCVLLQTTKVVVTRKRTGMTHLKKIFCEKKDHKVNIINLHVLEMGQTYWSEEQQKKNLTASFHGSTPSPIFILNIVKKKL
jgi:hypothetical protein